MVSFRLATLTAIIGIGALACADGTGPAASRPLTVSFTTASSAAATFSRTPTSASLDATTPAASPLVITRAQLVIARMEMQQVGASCTSTTASGDDDGEHEEHGCAELQVAPTIVDLPVNGTVVTALSMPVPTGTYSGLEAKIHPIGSQWSRGKASTAFLAAHPEFDGVNVLVEGTYNGTPFTYKGVAIGELEHRFDPPLEVGTDPLNLTVNVDMASWFRASDGTTIDPSTANLGGPNALQVAINISRSLHAFRDDDHDGHDDHGELGEHH
jgi:hypothetical protein